MKNLRRYWRLNVGFGLHRRFFSVLANARCQSSNPEPEDLVYVGTSTTATTRHVSSLHGLVQLCARARANMEGKACHAQVIRVGLQADTLTSNMLINMYSKCGLVGCARKVFDEMLERSLVSWNTMIGSLAQNGEEQEALGLFVEMQREGTQCSEFTVSSVLCACAAKCAVFECKQLHSFAIKAAMESNVFVGTALLDVYAKCSLIKDASWVFECMPERSDVTWSSMVAGYVQNGLHEEALGLFCRTQMMGLEQNQFMISSAICACAGLAALIEGKQLHAVLCKSGFGSNMYVVSSLIDMYAKCGCIREANVVFQGVEEGSIVLWNAMISGFARHAHSLEAMVLFEKMQQMGMYPNEVTYIAVLSACSHMGLVEKGRKYFHLMIREHRVLPNVFHYSCMVDIFGRAGLICEAYDLIEKMPFDATASMWGSLLASCRVHGNLELAEVAAKHLFEMEPNNAGNHILLSNIYAANRKWEEVARARKLLKESEVKKEKGMSWIEIKDKVHSFMVGEINHPKIAEIYFRLDDLVKKLEKLDYKAETKHDLHYVEESRKQQLLRHHSEKLALTFGLMCLPQNAPIRIMKNLRICGDCHSFMKATSNFTGREIIVRDTNRFHHFESGCCSCGDFW
ncbi:pentatricopeptide repeat-containing protein At5g04780, mitochondrial-like [Alnus glutinosa]|uniref:pentatricopeptide repeat-containing protein At5g04780, mitochondrial-like n=1 Tax=Alnus glutinosa TaxID=3517 RepID=UPI002D7785CB|nr:pentatricopeptide repeat-containing protein At5g04780, mitochondrial-like [Alnus glutinosa]